MTEAAEPQSLRGIVRQLVVVFILTVTHCITVLLLSLVYLLLPGVQNVTVKKESRVPENMELTRLSRVRELGRLALLLAPYSSGNLGSLHARRCLSRSALDPFCSIELPLQVGYPFLLLKHLASKRLSAEVGEAADTHVRWGSRPAARALVGASGSHSLLLKRRLAGPCPPGNAVCTSTR